MKSLILFDTAFALEQFNNTKDFEKFLVSIGNIKTELQTSFDKLQMCVDQLKLTNILGKALFESKMRTLSTALNSDEVLIQTKLNDIASSIEYMASYLDNLEEKAKESNWAKALFDDGFNLDSI